MNETDKITPKFKGNHTLKHHLTLGVLAFLVLFACQKSGNTSGEKIAETSADNIETQTKSKNTPEPEVSGDESIRLLENSDFHDSSFVFIKNWSDDFVEDMKYATKDNFIGKKVYDCDRCMVRKKVALALIKANHDFMSKGYRIKFFDCYRPLDVQKIMWNVYPVEGYVANPHTSGSIHNRGGAVDITLVDQNNRELNMGTAFDYFGREAHHDYDDLPGEVLKNRQLLKDTMKKHGFHPIKTEWWHYNFSGARSFALSNFPSECD